MARKVKAVKVVETPEDKDLSGEIEVSVAAPAPTTFFVAPGGSDSNSGTQKSPFVTLERARDALREQRAARTLVAPVTVWLRGGTYPLPRTLELTAEDSGTAQLPVTWRAWQNEKPVLVGGKTISGFEPYKGKILKVDLSRQGFPKGGFKQLIFNGVRQVMARYPNYDPQNPYTGGYAYVDGKPKAMYTDYPDDNQRVLQYAEKDERKWAHPEDGQVFIFARYNWWNDIIPIKTVDRASRTLTLASDASYPIRPTDRYFVQGMLEELDAPGEWYLDPRTMVLYFWPPEPLEDKTVCAPTMRTMIQLGPDCNFVTFRGLTIEGCDGDAIKLTNCSDCGIIGNTIRNVGDYNGSAVVISGGFRNGVVGNDIFEVGRDGVSITGGDRITLTPGESFANNNYIHHVGLFYKWGCGIIIVGCGLRATRNLIHDCPRAAIGFGGNNLVMEYNHMRHLCLDSEDAAGIGTGGRDWISSRGSSVSYNYIHDVYGYGRKNGRWVSPYFAWGIYLDDNTGGVDVIGNIVTRCGRGGLHLHNSRDTVVRDNIFIDNTDYQVELSGWNKTSQAWKDHLPTMIKGYNSVIDQPAWKTLRGMHLYPENAPLEDGTIMAGNIFERNIFAAHDPAVNLVRIGNMNFQANRWDNNIFWQYGNPVQIDGIGSVALDQKFATWQKLGADEHSLVADPQFVNTGNDDFRLKPGTPAAALGFTPTALDKIGPYKSELRASWPIREAEGVREHPLVVEDPKEAVVVTMPRLPAGSQLDSGLEIRIEHGGSPFLVGRAAVVGENLALDLTVSDATMRVDRDSPWLGASVEIFAGPEPAHGKGGKPNQLFLIPADAQGPAEVRPGTGSPAPVSGWMIETVPGGWRARVQVPLPAMGIDVAAAQFRFDILCNANSPVAGQEFVRLARWGSTENHSDIHGLAKAVAAPSADMRYPEPFTVERLKETPAAGAVVPAIQQGGLALTLAESPGRAPVPGPACKAWVTRDEKNLYVALTVPGDTSRFNRGMYETWGETDGAELCFADASGKQLGRIFVLHGFVTGKSEGSADAGASEEEAARVAAAMKFTVKVQPAEWSALWVVPLSAAGISTTGTVRLAFNIGVRRTEKDEWICWAGPMAQTWHVESAGIVELK